MAERLMKRKTSQTTVKSIGIPKVPEPETTLCTEPVNVAVKEGSLLGKCIDCKRQSNSEVDHLCYDCHMEATGFVFDEDTKRYVKRRK